MKRFIFNIEFGNEKLVYDPIKSIIYNPNKQKRIKLPEKRSSTFPIYHNIEKHLSEKYYRPAILTLYQGLDCNLDCKYCFTPYKELNYEIPEKVIKSAADFVSKNAKKRKFDFVVGFRGGNEPLLKLERVKKNLEICREIAKKNKVRISAHTITNGAIPIKTAEWASQNFDSILLSWDGPEHIQNENRPFINKKGSFDTVRQTAQILLSKSSKIKELEVRVTVTKGSVEHLVEITEFLYKEGIQKITFFPVHQNHNNQVDAKLIPDKNIFVENFLRARKWGKEKGLQIAYLGTRINEIHDKNCNIFQFNLALTPEGYLSSCFEATHNIDNQNDKFIYGKFPEDKNKPEFDWGKLIGDYKLLSKNYDQCKGCFNILHCNKMCPVVCPLNSLQNISFDCSVEYQIGLANLIELAGFKFSDAILSNTKEFFSNVKVGQVLVDSMIHG